MNPLRSAALSALLATAGAVSAQVQWTPVSPATVPPARGGHGFVFAGPLGGVLFGGQDGSTYLNDTWQWNGSDWTQLQPATSPSRRAAFAMCYDPVRNVVVLFSGWDGNRYLADTWEFDGTTWTQATPATMPPPRDWHVMDFDPISGRVILFGGHDWQRSTAGLPNYGDTWSWDGTTWTQLQPANPAPPGWGQSMVYHAARGRLILHGGTAGTDTWEWLGNDWAQIPTGNPPPARTRAGIAYDPLRAHAVMWGGVIAGASVAEVWEFNGADWVQRAPGGVGPAVSHAAGIFDPLRGAVLNFGGALAPNRSSVSSATDAYGPVSPAASRPFGAGCAGTAGVPSMDVSRLAWAGAVYDVGVQQTPASAAVWFVVGFSNTRTTAGASLPLSLAGVGMTGCSLLVDPVVAVGALADPAGEARLQLAVANSPNLVGRSLFAQALVASPGSNALGLVASNGAEHVIGGL